MRYAALLICFIICLLQGRVSAQVVVADSIKQVVVPKSIMLPSPRRAAMLSAALPGAGQIYNHKYWKLPILYGGLGAIAYFIKWNNDYFNDYREAYLISARGNTTGYYKGIPLTNTSGLASGREYYRHNRDLLVIVGSLVYLLNVADATVDAHLASFDVTDNLNVTAAPVINASQAGITAGVGVKLTLK